MTKTEALKDAQALADQSGQSQIVYQYKIEGRFGLVYNYTNYEAYANYRVHRDPRPLAATTVKPNKKSEKK